MTTSQSPEGGVGGVVIFADIRFPLERANGIQTTETAHALARIGYSVELVVRRVDSCHGFSNPLNYYGLEPHSNLTITSLDLHTLFARPQFLAKATLAAAQAAGGSPRWVLTRDLILADAILSLPRTKRPPVFFEAHTVASVFAKEKPQLYGGGALPTEAKLRRLDRREARVCRKATGIVAITKHLAEALESHHDKLTHLEVIPDGCRVDEAAAPKPAGQTNNPFHVMYVGQLYPWKGIDTVIQAMTFLPETRLTIVGGLIGESDHERVRKTVQQLSLENRVTMTGLIPPAELDSLRQEADVFVVPNLAGSQTSEAFTSPLKLFESMAAARPIVASALPSLEEILRDDDNALLAPAGDAPSFAKAIRRLRQDSELRSRLAATALGDVQAFSWEKRADRLGAFAERLLAADGHQIP